MFFCFKNRECINEEKIKRFYKKFGIEVEIEGKLPNINIKIISGYDGNYNSYLNVSIETLNSEDKIEFQKYLTEKNNLRYNNNIMNKKITDSLNQCNYQGSIQIYDEIKAVNAYIFGLYLCKKGGKTIGNFSNTETKEKFTDDRGYFMKGYDENIFLNYIYMGLKKYRSKKINLRYVLKGYTEQIFALIYYHCHYSSGNVAVYGKVEFEMLSLLSMKEKLLLVFFDVISIILIIIAFMLVFV